MDRARVFAIAAALTFATGCGSPSPVEVRGANLLLTVALGADVRITLQTIGPGEYAAPPTISAPFIRFESVSLKSPYVPAGPTQEFRFRAEARGRAIVTFTNTYSGRTVDDTVVVR